MPRSTPTPKTKTPPTTLVLLVRHGQTATTGKVLPGRAKGLHLSDKGREQAQAAAERIAALDKVDAVYASPLERTRETAAPIAKARGLTTTIERGLLECDFGKWTGRQLRQLMRKPEWKAVQQAPSSFRFPAGESFAEMQTRMITTVQRLAERHRGGVVVCVSHADPIKAVMSHAAGAHLDQFQRLVISPCSISALLVGAHTPIVLTVNSLSGGLGELRPS